MDRHGLSCCRVSFWTFILQSIGSESKSAWKKSKNFPICIWMEVAVEDQQIGFAEIDGD